MGLQRGEWGGGVGASQDTAKEPRAVGQGRTGRYNVASAPSLQAYVRIRSAPADGGTQRGPARGGHRAAVAPAGAGRCRFGQDPRADPPHCLAGRGRRRITALHPRGDLHQQGRRRNARAHRGIAGHPRAFAVGGNLPRHCPPHAAAALEGRRPGPEFPDSGCR